MKRSLKALAWAAACWLVPASAQAQSYLQSSAYSPTTQQVSYFNTGACTDPNCAAADPSCGLGEAGCGMAGGCGNGACGNGGCGSDCCGGRGGLFRCCTAAPWTLKDAPGFNYGGWIQVGWQDRNDGAFTGNGPFATQGEHGQVNLNQLYSFVEKVADGSCGLDWGFRFDSYYGVDGNEGQAFDNVVDGYWDYLNGFDHGAYEIALPQAYAQLALGKWSTKIGHFYTPIGYELVTSPGNFFLSRQMTFYNSEPFTHTGIYSTYNVSDSFNFSSGWTQGWNTGFYQFNNANSIVGGFTWAMSDRVTLNWYGAAGNFGARADGFISSGIVSIAWTDRFSTVHQMDVLDTNNTTTFQANGIACNSVGVINYAFYQLTDCIKYGTRLEWYKADGASYQTLTSGVNIKLGPNMILRPETRYMWSNDSSSPVPGANLFSTNSRMVLGCDWIFTF